MREVLEQVPPAPSRGRHALLVVVGLGIAALVATRLLPVSDDEPVADPPPPPPAADDSGAPLSPLFAGDRVEPISNAPLTVRMIELVSANRLTLFHGQLGSDTGRTTVIGPTPYATDDVIIEAYGAGIVVGPAPGTAVAGTVRGAGVDVDPPAEPVAGILPALGGGYWIMDTERTATGACQLHLVMLSGQRSDAVVTYPCEFVPEHETVRGFVGTVGSRISPSSGTLLDRETGSLVPLGGALLASADRYLARWTREPSDPIVIDDLVNRTSADVDLLPGRTTRQVELSPDGSFLAVVYVERLITVRSYEVWVYDLIDGGARMATVTTLDSSPLELAWRGDILVVVGNDVEAYDTASDRLYRSPLQLTTSRLDAIAMPFELQ